MLSRLTSNFSKLGQEGAQDATTNGADNNAQLGPKLKALDPKVQAALQKAGIPLISCSACPSPCDPSDPDSSPADIHSTKLLSAWSKQDIDFDEDMFPSNSPFLRHVLISTGKKDWVKDVASVQGSLAHMFEEFVQEDEKRLNKESNNKNSTGADPSSAPDLPHGCWQTTKSHSIPERLFIGNSSQISSSSHSSGQNVMLFPDYVLLTDVQDTTDDSDKAFHNQIQQAARRTYDQYISPHPRLTNPTTTTRRWALPYRATVVLCSHHKRDARCGIAAPMLAEVFKRYAEKYGWEVDERGDEIGSRPGTNEPMWDDEKGVITNKGWGYIDDQSSTSDRPTGNEQLTNWKKLAHNSNTSGDPPPTLGIFYTSHIGKHKYSGNVIIYFPNGAGVWYGRVDPLDGAGRVFEQTILNGKIIPEYLRAGINLWRGEHQPEDRVSGSKVEMQNDQTQQGILKW
ncbi:unnamed protein product [Sympodiomycopsis kandeliae]